MTVPSPQDRATPVVMRRLRRLPARLRRRRLRVYGVGIGKSGTTSLARMFAAYRAAHEVDAERFLPVATAVLNGELAPGSARVKAELRRRSWRFHLDVDCAPFLSGFTATLADLYPDAKFVLTIRDCFSWLDSQVEWQIRVPPHAAPMWAPHRKALFGHFDEPFAPEEGALDEAGLIPIASYFRSWAERNARVIDNVDPVRLLVVRTEDLDRATGVVARFVGVPESTVQPAHANRNTERTGLLGRVPRDLVVARAEEHCAELMEAYWGADWRTLASRLPSYEVG